MATVQRKRVLVVDDNEDAAATLAELIELIGAEVEVAYDGASAVAAVQQRQPGIVLLDISLPDFDGYEVARRVRALTGVTQPYLIALTGWGREQDKQLAQQAGFDEHWSKPVDPQKLMSLMPSE
jgi:CheY-like chemotaxis protein